MLAFLVPHAGDLLHFLSRCLLSTQQTLDEYGLWESRECELWYSGCFRELVQPLSRYPVQDSANGMPADRIAVPPHGTIGGMPHQMYSREDIQKKVWEHFGYLWPIRQRFREAFAGGTPRQVTLVQRQDKRRIDNMAELIAALDGLNIALLDYEDTPPEELIRAAITSDVLIGPCGQALAPTLFMNAGATAIECFPRGWYSCYTEGLARNNEVNHWQIESQTASRLGLVYGEQAVAYLAAHPWPNEMAAREITQDLTHEQRRNFQRTLRDVAGFEIDVPVVAEQVRLALAMKALDMKAQI